ncbi:pre-mRNA-splicing factor 38B-like [Amphibalanus amphitrite]|uniref:pre-mRNA-splicing factor 38B-like n=1 Tax=Amphibalanus amphitrite TaxID=1232801 RepID=UPI001C912CC4|nr:pre-mRNA-splicing factor 38B-like [Amphibalanus amphitrite]XP_043196425.1 pre-mRNA-splicing factor 38B-like [Amphibalanus amphitrite]XP_043196426.1 pre-mRNA-splicing factor 38B-like [Amphibalanus amphitrite]
MASTREHSEEEDEEDTKKKNSNTLPLWGNEKTMNLNTLLLTNIQSSHYFKVNLFEYKTYHEVIDEIYYKVTHLEPWEKGSRKTAGQSGMCGGVRGVGVGGIVSTAFSCLYKLFTLRLTRKQVTGLLNHTDSPYLRGLGFMYLRYTQPPADLWGWFEPFLEDEEMIDVKAGGGEEMMMGVLVRKMLTKLDWYGTLFPRIPVPIQMKIQKQLQERFPAVGGPQVGDVRRPGAGEDGRRHPARERSASRERQRPQAPPRDIAEEIALEKERIRREREGSRGRDGNESNSRDRRDSKSRERHDSKTREHRDSKSRDHRDSKTRDHRDSKSREHRDERRREREHRSRDRDRHRSRSRSRERRHRRSRSRERRADGRRERSQRSRSGSRERRRRSRERDRHRDERRHRRSGSRERRR